MFARLKTKIVFYFYHWFASKLPPSYPSKTGIPKKLRAWCGRFLLDHCGKDVNIEPHVDLRWGGNSLGDRSGFGAYSVLGGNTIVGNDVMIGREFMTITRNHIIDDPDIPMIEQGFEPNGKIIIDDDVWIGNRVTILPNVHVHSHSVIAAGAVVTKDVPEYAVVGGVPARVIRYRNEKRKDDSSCD